MIHDFVRTLRTQYEEEIAASVESLARGQCEDLASYKYLTGRIQGLRECRDKLIDLAKKADDDE